MKSRRVYIFSVVALFVLAVSTFVMGYVMIVKSHHGLDPITHKPTTAYWDYQARMKPFKLLCAALPPIALIGIMMCSIIGLDHTDTLRISTRSLIITLCIAILLFLFIIFSGTL